MFNFLDFIFPKKCVGCSKFGAYFCEDCFGKIEFVENPVCPVCQRQAVGGKTHPGCASRLGLDGLVVACRYRGPVKAAIAKVKYKWIYDIGEVLADLLVANLWRFSLPNDYILVPIPLHFRRKNWRGFNQAELLAKILSQRFNVSKANILVRNRETKTQVGLKRDERIENMRGAFSITPTRHPEPIRSEPHVIDSEVAQTRGGRRLDSGSSVKGQKFLLVDDVFTSGATMMEAAKILKKAGARSVWAMVVALG
ncbi:hypothetical protein A3G14_02940 [Candidatus Curtissbacteria bacterium RIFCSPLOWO2_12_FULL_38_9]|uniref:Phosphoribosyltransferase domain-containing protein n=2 Tax=Candidatus Curtissiibacteriota TaxID=1752717 RepID=A0A1F5IAU3_9BACT|nr:MAG: hypothetical protein A3G14_02940 [Candidatus Curtissbacteria bacterium RIFCSPLOWO2_12_FULL_38_9]